MVIGFCVRLSSTQTVDCTGNYKTSNLINIENELEFLPNLK